MSQSKSQKWRYDPKCPTPNAPPKCPKIGTSTTGFNTDYRMVISNDANDTTLAHETGHACGLKDIYVDKGGHNINGEGILKSSHFLNTKDWAAGFYDATLKLSDLILRPLMYGNWSTTKGCIPHGSVWGVYNKDWVNIGGVWQWTQDIGHVDIGLDKVKLNPKHLP